MKECCIGAWGDFTGEKIGISVVVVAVVFFALDFSLIKLLRDGEVLPKIYLGGFLGSFFLAFFAYVVGPSFLATLLMLCLTLISLLILNGSTLMGLPSDGGFSKKVVSSSSMNFWSMFSLILDWTSLLELLSNIRLAYLYLTSVSTPRWCTGYFSKVKGFAAWGSLLLSLI